jgi:hypothetical protein
MPLHNFLCVDWFLLLEEKDFKNYLKNSIGILEKEKKMEILSFLNFWPEGLLPLLLFLACSAFSPPLSAEEAASPLHKPLAYLASAARAPSLSPVSRNGPAQPSAAEGRNALLFSLRVAATLGLLVGIAIIFFLPRVTESDTSKESDAAPTPWLPCTARRATLK